MSETEDGLEEPTQIDVLEDISASLETLNLLMGKMCARLAEIRDAIADHI